MLSNLGLNQVGQIMAVLGLDSPLPNTQARRKKRGLWMAAKMASVSYKHKLSPETLEQILTSGTVSPLFEANLNYLLDETPVSIVVMAVEETALNANLPPKLIWRNVVKLAKSLSIHRSNLWTAT
jgi:hypothetical protein